MEEPLINTWHYDDCEEKLGDNQNFVPIVSRCICLILRF
jgi:hypothetical protein